jgi:hypothetical protein
MLLAGLMGADHDAELALGLLVPLEHERTHTRAGLRHRHARCGPLSASAVAACCCLIRPLGETKSLPQLLKKHALLQIDERSKSETEKGLIFSFVSGRWIRQGFPSPYGANTSFV